MTKIDGVSPLIRAVPILQPRWKEFTITVESGVNLASIYACIHKLDEGDAGIETEVMINYTGGSVSISLDISKIATTNGFQVYGVQLSTSGESEIAVGLTGNSTYLTSVSTLHLARASSEGIFPTAT